MLRANTFSEILALAPEKEFAITLGNFDGVHLGHQHLLNNIRYSCQRFNKELIVVTFIPHPREILFPDQKHYLLTTYKNRRKLLKKLGIKYLIELPFTRDLSTLTPSKFLHKLNFDKYPVTDFYIGYDFAFGANKEGNYEFLKNYLRDRKINLHVQKEFKVESITISSTWIRHLIRQGNVANANKLLGKTYSINGTVIKGAGRGKTLGFPTANIKYTENILPPCCGVYATKTYHDSKVFKSITNVGRNPTFLSSDEIGVETHLIDFEKDIYGENIEIEFHCKLRDEKKFESADELVSQINKDQLKVIEYFS
ncbi:MAG: bifunctional riboflavin kinase/FAD synthetase [Bacteriovoracia bacterium]